MSSYEGGGLKRALRFVLVLLLSLALSLSVVLYVIINFSEKKTDLTCRGYMQNGSEQKAEIAYVILSEFRWWTRLWSDSDGVVRIQTDKSAMMKYVSHLTKIGEGSLALFVFRDERLGKMIGGYRVANGEITIQFIGSMIFAGKCDGR